MTKRQRRFVQEFAVDLNATQAAIRAGFSKNGASVQASRLLANASIAAEIAKVQEQIAEKAAIDAQWVLDKLVENHNKVTRADKYEGAIANRSLELIGKHLGMFVERSIVQTQELPALTIE
jgi:phage terminase small subunit